MHGLQARSDRNQSKGFVRHLTLLSFNISLAPFSCQTLALETFYDNTFPLPNPQSGFLDVRSSPCLAFGTIALRCLTFRTYHWPQVRGTTLKDAFILPNQLQSCPNSSCCNIIAKPPTIMAGPSRPYESRIDSTKGTRLRPRPRTSTSTGYSMTVAGTVQDTTRQGSIHVEHDQDDMRDTRAVAVAPTAARLTGTGRLKTAKRGLRVHKCMKCNKV